MSYVANHTTSLIVSVIRRSRSSASSGRMPRYYMLREILDPDQVEASALGAR